MKKTLLNALLCGIFLLPLTGVKAQSTVVEGQSTEGKDFWVTFLKADSYDSDDKSIELSLTISAKEACDVTIENVYSGYKNTLSLTAGELREVNLYTGTAKAAASANDAVKCYSIHNEVVDTTAVHVIATANISLFASNWKSKSFDATNILPTPSLLDEYYIQSYPPSAHGGDTQQGTHFAIVAAEDNTVVEYVPTVATEGIRNFQAQFNNWGEEVFNIYPQYKRFQNFRNIGDTILSDTLKAGQVWYVWTGIGGGDDYDLSGTYVKALNGKKIAVFQGAPHTNIPYQIRDRDHIFSQAMPTRYWGNTFAITSSMTRGRDKIRIMALNDETEVRINGQLVHTFHFETDNTPSGAQVVQCSPKDKRTFEFEIGAKGVKCTDSKNKFDLADPLVEGTSCYIETSCPVSVHLFMVSDTYDNTDKGDPAMLWINPIEQVIDNITFATYKSSNTHYFNVVTTKDNIDNMQLDGNPLTGFTEVSGSNDKYYFVRQNIPHGTHTLSGTKGFIAHVYGYGSKESYGYSAGGATKPLTQFITINGQIFSADTKNTLCSEDTIKFACHPDYEFEKMEWFFGDGDSRTVTKEQAEGSDSIVPHYYKNGGVYDAYVLIYRESSNLCAGQNAVDRIPITVTIGRYEFSIGNPDIPCPEDGKAYIGRIPYTNSGHVNLHGDNVTIEFDEVAQRAGFDNSQLVINNDFFQITIPENDRVSTDSIYGIHLVINSDCGGADTTLNFGLSYDKDIIDQRYNNVLGLKNDPSFNDKTLSDYQWYRVSGADTTLLEEQVSSNLNFYDLPYGGSINDTYFVCFWINKGTDEQVYKCACAKAFDDTEASAHKFDASPEGLTISAAYTLAGDKIFVNADWNGKTDIDCYAQWIDISGHVYQDMKFDIPDGGCTIPTPAVSEPTLYLLRVVTGKGSRSFKFIIK